jgi:alpha-amylase
MPALSFYFQVHQPYRLKRYRIFDVGKDHDYFNGKDGNLNNKWVLEKVAKKCYLPANAIIYELLTTHPEFRASYSLSGVVLDQFEEFAPEVLRSFQKLVDTGKVEILDETYYHSLSHLYSKDEFIRQVVKHRNRVKELFGVEPTTFRNTELIYNNDVAKTIEDLGYTAILAEGADHVLHWRSPDFVYKPVNTKNISLLLKNYKLSDDIAFRFSSKWWEEYPLDAGKYSQWISAKNGTADVINLFMDYETFGEHQWEDTGIFEFLRALPNEILKHKDNTFLTPSQVAKLYKPVADLDVPHYMSWADVERDLSAWLSNPIQHEAIGKIYKLEKKVLESGNEHLLEDWRRLQTSDHFYYMCTKWFADGDVHKYFNPYETPFDAFISYMNVLEDFERRLEKELVKVRIKKQEAERLKEFTH